MQKALKSFTIVATLVGLLALGGACRRSGAPAGALKKESGEKVSEIVFIGKQDACDCTKRRVKESWEAMQFALKKHAQVKVKRLASDVDQDAVRKLRSQRRYLTLPAIYFFNPKGKLVGMLEGELTPDKFDEMLK